MTNLHVSILSLGGIPGEAYGVRLDVSDAELTHAHSRAQHSTLQRTTTGHCFILEFTIHIYTDCKIKL